MEKRSETGRQTKKQLVVTLNGLIQPDYSTLLFADSRSTEPEIESSCREDNNFARHDNNGSKASQPTVVWAFVGLVCFPKVYSPQVMRLLLFFFPKIARFCFGSVTLKGMHSHSLKTSRINKVLVTR